MKKKMTVGNVSSDPSSIGLKTSPSKKCWQPGTILYAFSPNTWETEASLIYTGEFQVSQETMAHRRNTHFRIHWWPHLSLPLRLQFLVQNRQCYLSTRPLPRLFLLLMSTIVSSFSNQERVQTQFPQDHKWWGSYLHNHGTFLAKAPKSDS